MLLNVGRAIFTVALLFALAACSFQERPSPGAVTVSPEEARQFFRDIVNDTLQGRFDHQLCQKAAGQTRCQNELRDMASVAPVKEPRIRCIYPADIAIAPPGESPLGQVIVVEGQDKLGRPFTTEVFVFRDEGRLVAKNIIWWSGADYSTEYPNATPPKPTGAREPNCPE